MGNKIITEKDFWVCTLGTTPAQFQSRQTPHLVKTESGHKYITVADTATSSWIDFGCKKLMWIMAILAAVVAVAVVATGGAALGAFIAAGAMAGAAGAAFGAVVGALICGQKAAAARKWLSSKPESAKDKREVRGIMNERESLAKIFEDYLKSGLDPDVSAELCPALNYSGFHNESFALRKYLESQAEGADQPVELNWGPRKCYVGINLPPKPNPGDVWFDIVELTPMILIPLKSNIHPPSVWLAMHPVYEWQFKGFLGCVKLGRKRIELEHPADYLSAKRFNDLGGKNYITDVYHDEALAYAGWFGKILSGQDDLRYAKTFLNDSEFSMMLPKGMRLWDGSEFPSSEFVRTATGIDTLYKELKDQYAEFLLRESGDNLSLPDRMLYEEWERRGDIGFSTSDFGITMPLSTLPSKTIFFDLENASPRYRSPANGNRKKE
ncbi:MAG: hypothetical protein J2P21_11955 [Chloracidobacterium sp.]|nr:hypothetical protein [Chloracidobacterium sp.]